MALVRKAAAQATQTSLVRTSSATNREADAQRKRARTLFRPDVVTLDINMPEMDGLTALSLIMAERPVAVVMVSSLTEQGALAMFEALHLGAVDYITKPGGTISLSIERVSEELVAEVRSAARAKPRGKRTRVSAAARGWEDGLVVIGASTGGPRALEIVLSGLPA
jgi:two-component system chemotaxis response regulator CheB